MIIAEFFAKIDNLPKSLNADINTAVHLVCKYQGRQLRDSGEPYLEHIFDVTYQLLQMDCDCDTVIAGCLHDIIEDSSLPIEIISKTFNPRVAFIVEAVSKKPKDCFPDKATRLAEFHERFVECAKIDPNGVIWNKLADRLHNLVTLHGLYHDPRKQERIATETLSFYIPFLDEIAPQLFEEPSQKYLKIYRHKMFHLAMAYSHNLFL